MPESPLPTTPQEPQLYIRRQPTWFVAAILFLILFFTFVVALRNEIRAYWFAHKLENATTLEEKSYYISSLISLREAASGAIEKISRSINADVRVLSVMALKEFGETPRLCEMLDDPDQPVRDASSVALAFMTEQLDFGAAETLRLTCCPKSCEDTSERAAAAATAALGRTLDKGPWFVLRDAAHSCHTLVRAQAIESLGIAAKTVTAPDPNFGLSTREIFRTLVKSLDDDEEFTGLLALEREIAAVSDFVTSSSGQATASKLPNPTGKRRVSDVTRKVLFDLTGHAIERASPSDATEESTLTDQLLNWYHECQNRSSTSMPTSVPDF